MSATLSVKNFVKEDAPELLVNVEQSEQSSFAYRVFPALIILVVIAWLTWFCCFRKKKHAKFSRGEDDDDEEIATNVNSNLIDKDKGASKTNDTMTSTKELVSRKSQAQPRQSMRTAIESM